MSLGVTNFLGHSYEKKYPPVNKHSNGKSPSLIGNTSSFMVDFPASYVRLPEGTPL